MQTLGRAEDSIHVEAPPRTVYDLVADVTRTPEYSPEVDEVVWLDDGGPRVGARFRARNRVPPDSRFPWHNTPIVMAAEPGREFAFARLQLDAGLEALEGSRELTPRGREFVTGLREPVSRLLAEPLADDVSRAADNALSERRRAWQEHVRVL